MTIHKLTAGSGYDYLTRQVAAQDEPPTHLARLLAALATFERQPARVPVLIRSDRGPHPATERRHRRN